MNATRQARLGALRTPAGFLALGFGSGLAPFAPGTVGTLAAVPVYLLLAHAGWAVYALVLLAMSAAGAGICQAAADRLGVHDDPAIVWDEFCGLLLALFLVPVGLPWLVAGFALFRVFDVVKPWPIRAIDRRLGGGLGIMLDDLAAGLAANLVLQVVARLAGA